MTETKVRCDVCGAPAVPIRYDHDRVSDGNGGTDLEYKTVDLCVNHLQVSLQAIIYPHTRYGRVTTLEEHRKEFSAWVRDLSSVPGKWKS